MSTLIVPEPIVTSNSPGSRLRWALRDSWEMVKRNLRHIPRSPELLLDVTIQPVIFVLLFRYVFGGAIAIQGDSYVNYLMAGIFVQTVVFAAMTSGVGLAYDMQKGLIDRFRSLPMSRTAVVTGRTLTDVLRGMIAVVIMTVVGFFIGFRPEGSPAGWAAAIGLLLLFGFACSWVGVTIGMAVRTPEAVQPALFLLVFPFTFASSAFVPTDTMPEPLKTFAENQPVTQVINAIRAWVLGESPGSAGWYGLAWSLGILIVFFPIAIWLYQRRATS